MTDDRNFVQMFPGNIERFASKPMPSKNDLNASAISAVEEDKHELEEMLYARRVEIENFHDLENQRGTPIPALYNQFYRFIQNPSSVSVETFKRMIDTDDTIGSGADFLTSCLAARLGRYQHPSKEISEWVNDALQNIEGGWVNVCKELLSASWAGFAVAEKVWANTATGFVPKKIVTLPPGTLLFETERTGDLTSDGILQYQRNYNPAQFGSGSSYLFGFSGVSFNGQVGGSTFRPDMYAKLGDLPFPIRSANLYNYLSIRIPKMKCIHYSFDAQGKFGNPYGRSLLRRAYKYYVLKDATLQMLGIALDRKGTPLTVVYVDPNTTFIDPNKFQQGQSQRNKENGIRADLAVRDAFKNIHNDSVIILPGKKDQFVSVQEITHNSNATDFIAALDFYNKSIMRALLLPSLIFTNGDGTGSFALGQEHAKTFDKICDSILSGFEQTVLHQLIKEMIAYNFPRSAWEKDGLGKFGKRELTLDERDKEVACFTQAIADGAMDNNDLDDLNKYRETIGLQPRDTPIPKPEMEGLDAEGNPVDPGAKEDDTSED